MRYWLSSDVAPPLDTDGYFRGPLSPTLLHDGPADGNPRTLGDLDDVPCLILLGEGGIGKSTEIKAAHNRARADGTSALLVHLGSLTDRRIDRALLEHPLVVAWRERGAPLSLFLDALDEAPPQVPVAALLRDDLLGGASDALRASRVEHLRLRITCRPSVWPRLLDRAFGAFWGEGNVQTRTLAPLTRDDVATAAEGEGLDPERFLADIRDVGGGPWAALPLSLQWLLDAASDGALPATRTDLYEDACRRLCEEHNEGRQAVGAVGVLAPDHRLVVAARLAALMRLGGRTAVWIGTPDRARAGDLPARDVAGLDRAPGGGDLPVGERDIAEVVGHTGLFRAAGSDRARWVHESIPDFLAAWCLRHRDVDDDLALALLSDPTDRRVVPQLRDTAAWAASLNADLSARIAERDPVVAASGDPQVLSPDAREALTEQLLLAYSEARLDVYRESVPRPHALDHPRLADQLRRWLRDRTAGADARYEAIGIATRCGLSALVPNLFDVALDATDDLWVRASAVRSLSRLATPEALARLRPLALDPEEQDADGTLTSAARDALWPAHLSFGDLVASLDADPFERTTDGDRRHSRFHLLPSDALLTVQVVDGLRWAAGNTPHRHRDLVESVVKVGLQRAGDEAVAAALADVLILDLGEQYGQRLDSPRSLAQALPTPPPQSLTQAVIVRSARSTEEAALFRVVRVLGLVRVNDAPWLARWLVSLDGPARASAVRLVAALFQVADAPPGELQRAFDGVAAVEAPDLREAVDAAIQPWATDDERAERLREAFTPHPTPTLVEPPVADMVRKLLPAALDGERIAWYNIRFTLQTLPTSQRLRGKDRWKVRSVGRDHDLTQLDGWKQCPPLLQESIAEAAEAYLRHNAPDESDWEVFAGGEKQTYRVLDAPRAFVLLDQVAPDRLDNLPDTVWAAWLPAFLLLPASGDDRVTRLLARAATAHTEAATLARRALPIVARDPNRMALDLATSLLSFGRPDLTDAVLDFAKSDGVPEGERHPLWDALASHGVESALVRLRQSARGADAEVAATAVVDLLDVEDDAIWAEVADRFDADGPFAQALIAAVARSRDRQGRAVSSLSVPALLAFERRYRALAPPEKDEPMSGLVDDEARVHWMRRDARNVLSARGTREAEEALLALHAEFGDDDYARLAWEAARRRREIDFSPLSPHDTLRLLGTSDQRLVRSAGELFETVCHALAGFERWLRNASPPRVFDIWNAFPLSDALVAVAAHTPDEETVERLAALRGGPNPTVHVPKDENHLADFVQRYLRDRLSGRYVVSHREVEILKGHRPDLVVSTVPEGSSSPVSVAVEVKASWHPDVQTGMETQLANGYLDRSDAAHGVYLVGWYGAERWNGPPTGWSYGKRERAARHERLDLTGALADQARQLSTSQRHLHVLVVDTSLPPRRAS